MEKIIWEKYDRITHKSSGKQGEVTSYKNSTDEVSVKIKSKYHIWVGVRCRKTTILEIVQKK